MALSISDIHAMFFGKDEKSELGDETDTDGGFVPSQMDLSVRVGHGGQEDELAREIAKIQKQAEEIEESEQK
jgi:hypothetical protein